MKQPQQIYWVKEIQPHTPSQVRGSCHFSWGTPHLFCLLLNTFLPCSVSFCFSVSPPPWPMKQQAPVTEYFRYFCTFITSYHPQIRPILQRWGRTPQGYIQLLSRIAFLESQQSCSPKTSDKQALIHRGWWDFVHILLTGHELEYLPNLVWKSAGVFPSFLTPRPVCSLNCLSDQPSILYRHRIYHLWSLLLKSEGEKNSSVTFHIKWQVFAEEIHWLLSRSPDSLYYKA